MSHLDPLPTIVELPELTYIFSTHDQCVPGYYNFDVPELMTPNAMLCTIPIQVLPPECPHVPTHHKTVGTYTNLERAQLISRYWAKKRRRQYNRTIYASRQRYALSRKRHKGKFISKPITIPQTKKIPPALMAP